MTNIRLLIPGRECAIELQLPPSADLQYLSDQTHALPSVPSSHTLRFIHSGKLLTHLDNLHEDAVVHVAVTPPSPHVTLPMDETPTDDSPRSDWIAGFCMGVLMGLIMLVLSQDRTIALSRKCRTGVSIGAMVNVLFGLALVISDR